VQHSHESLLGGILDRARSRSADDLDGAVGLDAESAKASCSKDAGSGDRDGSG
jgi:hypothetical protein